MLSKVIKDMVVKKCGHEIRYPKDCSLLANHISQHCKTQISSSTLMRLFGFVRGTKEPRLYTLDIVAEYLGYACWEDLAATMTKTEASAFVEMEQLQADKLRKGFHLEFGYEPNRKIQAKYIGGFQFEVVAAQNSKLLAGDVIKFVSIVQHYPLVVSDVVRNGHSLGQYIAGKISGVTYIRRVKDDKPKRK